MAGKSGARQFTEADKAQALVALAANGGNIKRTAKDLDVAPATLRRWRDHHARAAAGQGQPVVTPGALAAAQGNFVQTAERIRDKALVLIEQRIDSGDIKTSELNNVMGTLDDKLTRAKGLPTARVDHQSALPKPDELRELMQGFVQGAMAAAAQRETEIVDAQVVELEDPLELPTASTP